MKSLRDNPKRGGPLGGSESDSGSKNAELSIARRGIYADALSNSGSKHSKNETMTEFVAKDQARADAAKASRAASADAMRSR